MEPVASKCFTRRSSFGFRGVCVVAVSGEASGFVEDGEIGVGILADANAGLDVPRPPPPRGESVTTVYGSCADQCTTY